MWNLIMLKSQDVGFFMVTLCVRYVFQLTKYFIYFFISVLCCVCGHVVMWYFPLWQRLNINQYATKKTVAESMLDVALLMANASQLKAVLEQGPEFKYYLTVIVLIAVSLFFQVLAGAFFILMGGHCSIMAFFFSHADIYSFLDTL